MVMSFMKDFDHLKIQMKDIVSATNNFDAAKVIGSGGFGRVYKGELGQITFAFKKLDRRLGQGNIEFWKEVMTLSRYKHENLISLMHFCIEGDEMILVYEYATRGSLDRYLSDASTLTWIQRLRICVGTARALHFLHDPKETAHRVLHRDIKSANILLDDNWTAKVSDFGLAKHGPANQKHTYLVSHGVGTPGYCDPLYMEFGFLSKESDVYSFGVVLFEVLCGRLCCEYHNYELTKILVPMWRQCFDEENLDNIILPGLREQMDLGSLKSYSNIAYQCVKKAREERPMMAKILEELELSLAQQEMFEGGDVAADEMSSRLKTWWDYYNSDECPEEEFIMVFRMSIATFNMITDELDYALTKMDATVRWVIPVPQQVAVCLYHLATGDPFQSVSDLFGLGISTCRRLILEVCGAIRTILMPKFLKWPDEELLEQIKTEFESITGIPNIAGSMYTSHISIMAPKSDLDAYFNEKHTKRDQRSSYSSTVQCVVDSHGVIIDVCIGYPGSMSDDKILEKSAFAKRFHTRNIKNTSIVGISSYPPLDWLLVPYLHKNNTPIQQSFDEKIIKVQKIAKDAVMRLKGRWACLHNRIEASLEDLPMYVVACCVLHNICEINNEAMDEDLIEV